MSDDSLWHSGRCTACDGAELRDFLSLRGVPTQDGVLWKTQAEALAAPKGDFILSVCQRCGYIGNRAYDATLVTFEGYDVSLEHSPVFREYLQTLAQRLVERYGLKSKKILEIGVGKGLFLRTLCQLGNNQGIGYDPSVAPELRDQWRAENVSIVPDFFSEKYATNDADMVSCRHVLDILDRPKQFLQMLARSLGPSTVLYFESPNGDHTLEDCVIWSMVYEHCSWFTTQGARALFNACGFDILQIGSTFGTDYIGIEARPSPRGAHFDENPQAVAAVLEKVAIFERKQRETMQRWGEKLEAYRAAGKRVMGWGAGARAIAFLSAFGITDAIPFVIDTNPNRQGKYLPVTGQKVVPPAFVVEHAPDVVLITNPSFTEEIKAQARALGANPEFESL
jgi:SAM-dependent methyltransferase